MHYKTLITLVLTALIYSLTAESAEFTNPFVIPDASYSKISEAYEVQNMPPVRSQDALGVCYAFTATTLVQHELCQKNKWDCSNLKPEQQVSDAGAMLRFYDPETKERWYLSGGSDWTNSVKSMEKAPIITNKCAPFDQIVNQSNDIVENSKLQAAMWDRFERARLAVNQKLYNEECGECAQAIATSSLTEEEKNGSLNLKHKTELEKLRAFTMKTHEEAIQQLLVPNECHTENTIPTMKFPDSTRFPQNEPSRVIAIEMAKKWFKEKHKPLAMTVSLPTPCENNEAKACGVGSHQLVVAGYRKACNPAGKCIELLKLHNSWGQGWQNQNNDGWVEANSLFDNGNSTTNTFSGFE